MAKLAKWQSWPNGKVGQMAKLAKWQSWPNGKVGQTAKLAKCLVAEIYHDFFLHQFHLKIYEQSRLLQIHQFKIMTALLVKPGDCLFRFRIILYAAS
jgi:hypothetical protein